MGDKIEYWTELMLSQGIATDHIEAMKNRILEDSYKYRCCYDYICDEEHIVLLKTENIIGINSGWMTGNRSIYELFFSVTGELNNNNQIMHEGRIQENLKSLIDNGLDYQYNFYKDSNIEKQLRDGLPIFDFFEEDNVYFSSATHRTICAIMFKAPLMAGRIRKNKRNSIKANNYIKYCNSIDSWYKYLLEEKLSISVEKIEHEGYLKPLVERYIVKTSKENCLELFKFDSPINVFYFFDSDEKTNEYILSIKKVIEKLKYIDNYTNNLNLKTNPIYKRIRWLSKLRMIKQRDKIIKDLGATTKYISINYSEEVLAKIIENIILIQEFKNM